jgi:hypothetical protein
LRLCPCGLEEITRPHGKLGEMCRKKHQGHGKGRNGGRPAGQKGMRERKIVTVGTPVRKKPCLCCEKPFVSTHKGNRICPRCSRMSEDVRDQGRETHRGMFGGAE